MSNVQYESASILNKAVGTLKIKKPFQINSVDEVRAAIEELEDARRFFEAAQEPELVDYAIYREKAALMRLSYLLRDAKEKKKGY